MVIKINLHTKDRVADDWTNQEFTVAQIPALGEYIVISATSDWYLVTAVVHLLIAGEDFDAEVFAILDSQIAAIAKASKFPDLNAF